VSEHQSRRDVIERPQGSELPDAIQVDEVVAAVNPALLGCREGKESG
jgi:hypothetical protein